ncbi:hypothetical protein AGMMS50218_04430 [Actinomycetota bacterium]|nr:hypothetical protein AGMMS50218_04430 [Actinomycetota bacterium]
MIGFSLGGLLVLVAIVAPSLLLVVRPPADPWPEFRSAGVVFDVVEQTGRVVTCVLLVLVEPAWEDAGLGWSGGWAGARTVLLAVAATCAVLNYVPWVRYLRGGRRLTDLFRPLCGLPVPSAVLPVGVLVCIAVVGSDWWLAAATAVFAVGHVANSRHLAVGLRAA